MDNEADVSPGQGWEILKEMKHQVHVQLSQGRRAGGWGRCPQKRADGQATLQLVCFGCSWTMPTARQSNGALSTFVGARFGQLGTNNGHLLRRQRPLDTGTGFCSF